ncbi:hypothetical protein M413DRAFT_437799 [Hebeloma cylindrosporum]|uniref:Uncharacterized protein n=1 Tax=Hebeloma cylindrosporum TaxID=76867 RepID=A0A0C3CXS2_HEBCY|nr:hypothetical protein M413DRAFT_437799 [Hebeloma cylindrosporum h7]
MFAATTTDALSVSDPVILKKGPSSIPSCLDLLDVPTASSWSPDNTYPFISSARTIHRYEPNGNVLRDIYVSNDSEPISQLAAKEKDTVIFSAGNKVHVLECDANPKILQTFNTHKTPVNSLTLSNDNSLLASTSSGGLHVHNLAVGSHSVLRGLTNQDIKTSAFHPHVRTRLLVAAGKQLMVYDTTRPSGPMKTIVMNESATGDIAFVACSPFSKTLVAVATTTGFVGLVDLDKEKALFRTLNLKLHLTSLGFSPEGAAIYLGTDSGKILVVDLRALDRPPKTVTLSESGRPIQTISVQKKLKDGVTKTPVGAPATTTRKASTDVPPPPVRRATSTSKSAPSPARPLVPRMTVAASPTVRRVTNQGSPVKRGTTMEAKKVLSPVRDPLGNSASGGNLSAQLDELENLRRGKSSTQTTPIKMTKKPSNNNLRARPSASPRTATTSSATRVSVNKADAENPRRARTLPTSTSASALTTRKTSTASIVTSVSAGDHLGVPRASPQRRLRTTSSASRASADIPGPSSTSTRSSARQVSEGTSAASASAVSNSRPSSSTSRPGSSLSRMGTTSRDTSPVRYKSSTLARLRTSRTPSPEFPDMRNDPITPVPAQKKSKKGMAVLGLGTPEVERWIQAGKVDEGNKPKKRDTKGKGKTVGFQDELTDSDQEENDNNRVKERERDLSMQISPRRPAPGVSASGSTDSWSASPAVGPSPGGASAQELLKTIVQDVMYDFQRETKAEMMGLHLDLLRMGRGWKAELRTLMDEYVGDLRDLREENQRLRLENDRLRRGAY